jgi:hypothetical protein
MLWCAIVAATLVGFGLSLVLFGDLVATTFSPESHLSQQSWSGQVPDTPRR